MKFNNFEKAKESIGKAIRKTTGIVGIAAVTAGAIGVSSGEASAQQNKKAKIEAVKNEYPLKYNESGERVNIFKNGNETTDIIIVPQLIILSLHNFYFFFR